MAVFEIDPTQDGRWDRFLESHPRSTVFHRPEWLTALQRTYNYRPIALTTTPPSLPLTNGIVFCDIRSRITGAKLVSLPFSDHCDPLVDDDALLTELLAAAAAKSGRNFRYAEIRPRTLTLDAASGWSVAGQYHFHVLDLSPSLGDLHSRLHKDGMQRKIRRSEREHVTVDCGASDLLVREFYQLLLRTRRRHRLAPQPLAWFQNLAGSFGSRLTVHVARLDARPIASILTLRHNKTIVYKYGCSDERFHNLGGMPRLFWQVIQQAKADQLEELDLGRTDESNPGLIRFKDHLGASRIPIRYWRFPSKPDSSTRGIGAILQSSLVKRAIPILPDRLFQLAGRIIYRHVG